MDNWSSNLLSDFNKHLRLDYCLSNFCVDKNKQFDWKINHPIFFKVRTKSFDWKISLPIFILITTKFWLDNWLFNLINVKNKRFWFNFVLCCILDHSNLKIVKKSDDGHSIETSGVNKIETETYTVWTYCVKWTSLFH